ncbi:hypothetical protein D3C75_496880 [compost metagenome]
MVSLRLNAPSTSVAAPRTTLPAPDNEPTEVLASAALMSTSPPARLEITAPAPWALSANVTCPLLVTVAEPASAFSFSARREVASTVTLVLLPWLLPLNSALPLLVRLMVLCPAPAVSLNARVELLTAKVCVSPEAESLRFTSARLVIEIWLSALPNAPVVSALTVNCPLPFLPIMVVLP